MNVEDFTGKMLGQYEIRELLGVGGMGAVYRGYQVNLKREVAIKILPANLAQQAGYIERFNREAQTAAYLEHAHIVPVYDYGTQRGTSYIVMRLLTGGALTERLAQRSKSKNLLPSLKEVSLLLSQLASALDYAHSQGVIHRDIKPSNVMFDNQGNAYLVDFGIARLIESTSALTGTNQMLGTPSYMPPEQWRGEDLTPAADQYALGILVYSLVTGHVPYEAPTPYALMHKHLNEEPTPPHIIRNDLPEAVHLVLKRVLAKRPEERFPNVTSFTQAFISAIEGVDEQPTMLFSSKKRPDPPTKNFTPAPKSVIHPIPEPRPFYKNPITWAAALLALIIIAGMAIFALTPRDSELSVRQTEVVLGLTERALTVAPPTPTEIVTEGPTRNPLVIRPGTTQIAIATDTDAPEATEALTETLPISTVSEVPTDPSGLGEIPTAEISNQTLDAQAALQAQAADTQTALNQTAAAELATETSNATDTAALAETTSAEISQQTLDAQIVSANETAAAGTQAVLNQTAAAELATETPTATLTETSTVDVQATNDLATQSAEASAAAVVQSVTEIPSETPTATLTETPTPDVQATNDQAQVAQATADAERATETPTATETATDLPTATETPTETPTLDILATQAAQATAAAELATDTPTATETPTATASLTETPTVDFQATNELATRMAQATQAAQATAVILLTDFAAGTQSVLNETATAESWTDTPTPTAPATHTLTPSATPTPTQTPTLAPTTSPEQLALTPVRSNADWTMIERDFDGVTMVLVPAGCFIMGSEDFNDEKPSHEQCFTQPYWIDKYEVTNGQFARFNGIAGRPSGFSGDDRPRENINWFEARDFCLLRGARLPSEKEWEYAARGPDNLLYAWGNVWDANNAVLNRTQAQGTANVGSIPAGQSWVGVMDMSGNVWEWVSSLYLRYPYDTDHESTMDTSSPRVMRGGLWFHDVDYMRGSDRSRYVPEFWSYGVGFRCMRSF